MRPEEIVGLIGNISNRADIREAQSKQVQAIYDLLAARERETLERAAKLCEENAEGWRSLQIRAREANDTQAALAHLCEKDAALSCAREIRQLSIQDKNPSSGSSCMDDQGDSSGARGPAQSPDYPTAGEPCTADRASPVKATQTVSRFTNLLRILKDVVVAMEAHGCTTGDCPHDKQTECDANLDAETDTWLRQLAALSAPGADKDKYAADYFQRQSEYLSAKCHRLRGALQNVEGLMGTSLPYDEMAGMACDIAAKALKFEGDK